MNGAPACQRNDTGSQRVCLSSCNTCYMFGGLCAGSQNHCNFSCSGTCQPTGFDIPVACVQTQFTNLDCLAACAVQLAPTETSSNYSMVSCEPANDRAYFSNCPRDPASPCALVLATVTLSTTNPSRLPVYFPNGTAATPTGAGPAASTSPKSSAGLHSSLASSLGLAACILHWLC
ncbi:hypothetical protein HDU91_000202 [Kappamyces sp. JEL0680]|nr:hypothetical protein HDU91_000202 [Kappamyces sp. JEL0680]